MPPELQERVHQEVVKTKSRSGWPVQKTLVVLGIPRRSYYRWLAEKSWQQEKGEPVKPVQPYEATAEEKASRPDQRWGTDLMYLEVNGRFYYYIGFLDEYSRYLVHFELLKSMDGSSVSLAAQRAIETLPRDARGSCW